MKIAFATSNGIFVDSCFERTKSFYVIEFEGGVICSMKRRKINKSKAKEIKYSKFENRYELIKDCIMICSNRMDFTTKLRLENLGIRVLVFNGKIKEAINILKVI